MRLISSLITVKYGSSRGERKGKQGAKELNTSSSKFVRGEHFGDCGAGKYPSKLWFASQPSWLETSSGGKRRRVTIRLPSGKDGRWFFFFGSPGTTRYVEGKSPHGRKCLWALIYSKIIADENAKCRSFGYFTKLFPVVRRSDCDPYLCGNGRLFPLGLE